MKFTDVTYFNYAKFYSRAKGNGVSLTSSHRILPATKACIANICFHSTGNYSTDSTLMIMEDSLQQ